MDQLLLVTKNQKVIAQLIQQMLKLKVMVFHTRYQMKSQYHTVLTQLKHQITQVIKTKKLA